jgi:PAS domain S-box-containing protein
LVKLPGLRKATTGRRPLRVLIVEDSENDALLLLRELRRGGYEPEHERVQSEEAMTEALATAEWDVIISDYRLPRFGAPEALAVFRESGLEVPFIVVSGKVGEEAAIAALKAGAHDYVMKDNLARLSMTVERSLEEVQERRKRRRAESELRRRDAILKAVGFAAERFLGEAAGWEESIDEVLGHLGGAAGASRVYIFENYVGEDGELWNVQRHEWVAPGVSEGAGGSTATGLPYRAAGYGRWIEILGRGEPIHGHTREFPEGEQWALRAQDIVSIAVVPIFVEGEWWGFLGFDECLVEREWPAAEVDALKAAASTLGAALRRRRIEEELRGSEERYRAVIEQATDGIYLLDAETRRILESNPSFQKMLGYTADEMRGMEVYDFVAHPRDDVDSTIRRTLEQRRRVVGGRRYRRKDGSEVDVEVGVSVISHDGREVICTIVRDVTERKEAEEALRQSESLYRTVIEQATENICLVDVETRRIVESNPAFQAALGYTEEELRGMTLYDIIAHDRASVDENIRRTVEEGRRVVGQRKYRRKDGSLLDVEASGSIILRDDRETLCVVAHDVTERARAQALLEERVAALSRIAANLAFDLPTEDTLNVLAESAVNASTAVACAVILIDESGDTPHLFGSHGLPEGYTDGLQEAYRAGARSPSLEAYRTRRPVLVHDLRRFLLEDPGFTPVHHFIREVPWDIVYSLPLVSRDRAMGAIFFCYLPGEEPGEDERVFLEAVADQAAVAVENARLFAQARGKAALEERQRLARELHDSVSQALYGIALGAKTARTLMDQNPEQASDPLEYVLSLAEAGLAEMRALIFELRPESLESEGLVTALQKQAAALRARHEIAVEALLCEEPEASPEAKEAVYRIAQEALHNTVKHARANRAQIRMECDSSRINLEISDDGVGFEAGGEFPGHLGLRSMRERAERLGGTLEVETAPGSGTTIRARIPAQRMELLTSDG